LPQAEAAPPARHLLGQGAILEPASIRPEAPELGAEPRPRHPIGSGADRRSRVRAKFDGRVHIRGGLGTIDAFEDMARSVDATRDGLLFMSPRGGYWVGQVLQVAFPYWTVPSAINVARRAKVVRNSVLPDFRYAVAVRFEQPEGPEAPWLQPNAGQIKILGVEPDAAMADATIKLLEQDGYKVVMVRTTQQALDILEHDTPDVLLARAEGGVVSGRDLCTMVKRNLRLQHIPVILLTTSALPSDYSAGHRAGAVVCMRTPCEPERLQQAVHLVAAPPGQRSVYSARFNMSAFVRTS
jgi:CheY-like chemotaxis protein